MASRFGDFFSPSDLPYPTGTPSQSGQPACGTPFAPTSPDGFFNKILKPKELPYPMPPCAQPSTGGTSSSAGSSTSGTTSTADASDQATPESQHIAQSPAAPPVTIVLPPWPTAPATSATPATSAAPSTSATPQPEVTPVPASRIPLASDTVVTEYSLSPRLRARRPHAHELVDAAECDEAVPARMRTTDAAPITFTVPDGSNAVDLFTGAIEVNPDKGQPCDRDEIVTVGDLRMSGASPGGIQPGDVLSVVVPWRSASWVELAAEHLRIAVTARFYSVTQH